MRYELLVFFNALQRVFKRYEKISRNPLFLNTLKYVFKRYFFFNY